MKKSQVERALLKLTVTQGILGLGGAICVANGFISYKAGEPMLALTFGLTTFAIGCLAFASQTLKQGIKTLPVEGEETEV